MGTEYLVLWLEFETQTTSIDGGCGMKFFSLEIERREMSRGKEKIMLERFRGNDYRDTKTNLFEL
jgi:hypothetical protein